MIESYRNRTEPAGVADAATSLRMRMAQRGLTTTEVCQLVDRNRITVSRWRMGHTRIPLHLARTLHDAGLLDADALASIEATS